MRMCVFKIRIVNGLSGLLSVTHTRSPVVDAELEVNWYLYTFGHSGREYSVHGAIGLQPCCRDR
jgi:hypothetical protein